MTYSVSASDFVIPEKKDQTMTSYWGSIIGLSNGNILATYRGDSFQADLMKERLNDTEVENNCQAMENHRCSRCHNNKRMDADYTCNSDSEAIYQYCAVAQSYDSDSYYEPKGVCHSCLPGVFQDAKTGTCKDSCKANSELSLCCRWPTFPRDTGMCNGVEEMKFNVDKPQVTACLHSETWPNDNDICTYDLDNQKQRLLNCEITYTKNSKLYSDSNHCYECKKGWA